MNFYINPDFPYQTGRNPRLYWDNKRRTPPGIYLAGFWSSKKRKEGKYALIWTRLSCTRFSSNRVRLALFVLAYNLGNFLLRFALLSEVSHWSLTSIQLKLIKIGAKIVSHSRMTVFQMAEVAVSEKLFRSMLARIHRLGRACARAPTLSL